MTTNLNDSQLKQQIEELKDYLSSHSVNIAKLCLVGIGGGEYFLGELEGKDDRSDGKLRLWNPKRVIRIQQVSQGGVQVSIMIGDLELLEGDGTSMYVKDLTFSLISLQNTISQYNVYSLYKGYFERKVENEARAAGLHLPRSNSLVPVQ